MQIQQGVSLKPYNTFGMDLPAQQLVIIDYIDQVPQLSAYPAVHVLGGGSNVLLTQPVEGLVALNRLKGIELISENEDAVTIKVAAGEVWHELVLYAIDKGWCGIENLALIPGTVGAAPIQNIGAYGAEVKQVIEEVTGWHYAQQQFVSFTNADCRFGYRDSIFKQELKDKVFITSVTFRLSKTSQRNTSYGAIAAQLQEMNVTEISARNIAEAVIAIRSSKLPDPKQIGNAGSFFKNPTISIAQYNTLKAQYPDLPSYPVNETSVKLPAGWLIEQCGWKGYRDGDAGVHARQALVLVNYAHATGHEIWQLSDKIVQSVQQRFGIALEREVQVW